jgi:hypothetical protein
MAASATSYIFPSPAMLHPLQNALYYRITLQTDIGLAVLIQDWQLASGQAHASTFIG